MSSLQRLEINLPRSVKENLIYRDEVIIKASEDLKFRAEILEACRRDPCFWISTFAWSKNPDKPKHGMIPFILYEAFQDDAVWEIVNAIEKGEDILVEKTRKMGLSWLVIYIFVWFWLFRENSDFKMGSWKEDYVDKIGDMDTLFEKARFTVRNLPSWMQPDGYEEKQNATFCKMVNPENGNNISGEAPTVHFGSGGRRKAMLLDEFAKWDANVANGAWTATGDVTLCRVVVSTPYGSSNKYANLALGTKEKIKKLTLHWTLHPEKAEGAYYYDGEGKKISIPDAKRAFALWQSGVAVKSPWYDNECDRRSEQDVAQELDIDYLKSGFPFFSVKALKKQREWQYYKRKNPFSPIAYGFYVKGKLVEHDNLVAFTECTDEQGAWLEMYEDANTGMQYVCGGDTSEGQAKGDESWSIIRNSYTRNVCAIISGLISNDDYEYKTYLLCKYYNDALNATESYPSAYGMVVNKGLQKLGVKLYYGKNVKGEENDLPGFETNGRTRPMILDDTEEEIRKNRCELRSGKLIRQHMTFVKNPKKNGRPEAEGDMLDDGVMAYSIAGWAINEHPFNPKLSASEKVGKQPVKPYSKKKVKNAGASF